MQRRTTSATSALLQKANSQLKGERVKKPEDELNVSFEKYSLINTTELIWSMYDSVMLGWSKQKW